MSVPASPKPSANKAPILIMAFSIITVSNYWPSAETFYISKSLSAKGFLASLFTFYIIRSMGKRANSLASFEK